MHVHIQTCGVSISCVCDVCMCVCVCASSGHFMAIDRFSYSMDENDRLLSGMVGPSLSLSLFLSLVPLLFACLLIVCLFSLFPPFSCLSITLLLCSIDLRAHVIAQSPIPLHCHLGYSMRYHSIYYVYVSCPHTWARTHTKLPNHPHLSCSRCVLCVSLVCVCVWLHFEYWLISSLWRG